MESTLLVRPIVRDRRVKVLRKGQCWLIESCRVQQRARVLRGAAVVSTDTHTTTIEPNCGASHPSECGTEVASAYVFKYSLSGHLEKIKKIGHVGFH